MGYVECKKWFCFYKHEVYLFFVLFMHLFRLWSYLQPEERRHDNDLGCNHLDIAARSLFIPCDLYLRLDYHVFMITFLRECIPACNKCLVKKIKVVRINRCRDRCRERQVLSPLFEKTQLLKPDRKNQIACWPLANKFHGPWSISHHSSVMGHWSTYNPLTGRYAYAVFFKGNLRAWFNKQLDYPKKKNSSIQNSSRVCGS
jgi:hypothetical protein